MVASRKLKDPSGQHALELARSSANESDGRGSAATRILEWHAGESDLLLRLERLEAACCGARHIGALQVHGTLARLSELAPIGEFLNRGGGVSFANGLLMAPTVLEWFRAAGASPSVSRCQSGVRFAAQRR